MSASETGVYITLIAMMYEASGPVIDDENRLARLCGLPLATFRKIKSTLIRDGKIYEIDGGLINDRAITEIEFSEKKSNVASKSAKARWRENIVKSMVGGCVCNTDAMQTQCYPESLPDYNIYSEPKGSSYIPDFDENESVPSSEETPVLSEPNPKQAEAIKAFEAYNATATRAGWPKATKLTGTRAAALKRRIAEAGGLEGWNAALAKAARSSFLCGGSDRGWRADLDFFLQAKSFLAVTEGKYDDTGKGSGKPAPVPETPEEEAEKWRAYWARFGIDRVTRADAKNREDWGNILAAWFEAESWRCDGPEPTNPQCLIPQDMIRKYADKYGWDSPRHRRE